MFKLRDWSAIFGTRRQQNESFSEVSEGCGAIPETSVNIWLQSGLIRHSRDQTGVTVAKPELTRNKTTPLRWPCAAALFSRNFISNCWGDGAAARCRDGAAAGVWGEETMLEGAHSLIRGVGRAGSQIGVEIGELPYLNKVIFLWLITWWSCLTTTLDVISLSLKIKLSLIILVESSSSLSSSPLLLQPRVEATTQPPLEWSSPLAGPVTIRIPSAVNGWLNPNPDAPLKSHLTGGWHNSFFIPSTIKTRSGRSWANLIIFLTSNDLQEIKFTRIHQEYNNLIINTESSTLIGRAV